MSESVAGVEVPWRRLDAQVLRRVLEEYVTRESTDSGITLALDERVAQVQRALEKGEALLLFDPQTESTAVVERAAHERALRSRQE